MDTFSRRPGRPVKQDSSDTRERILDAALDLFAQYGYAGTSVRQIARAVKLSESALYNHFANKQALYEALLAESGPQLAIHLVDEALAHLHEMDPPQLLRAGILHVLNAWNTPRGRKTVSVLMQEVARGAPDIRMSILSSIDEAQSVIGKLIDGWRQQGLLQTTQTAKQIAWELFAPLGTIRFFYMNASATEDDIHEAYRLVENHLAHIESWLFADSSSGHSA